MASLDEFSGACKRCHRTPPRGALVHADASGFYCDACFHRRALLAELSKPLERAAAVVTRFALVLEPVWNVVRRLTGVEWLNARLAARRRAQNAALVSELERVRR